MYMRPLLMKFYYSSITRSVEKPINSGWKVTYEIQRWKSNISLPLVQPISHLAYNHDSSTI